MSETLADADQIDVEQFHDGQSKQVREGMLEVSRWTNYGHDRLYINEGISQCSKYSLYVDLKTHEIVSDNDGKHKGGSVEINGDEAVITIVESGLTDKEHKITVSLTGDGFETATEPREINFDVLESCVQPLIPTLEEIMANNADIFEIDNDNESKIVTDGGEDRTFTDAEILEQIEWHLDPESDDAPSVKRVRDLRAELRKSGEAVFAEWMDNIEQGHTEVVAEHDDKIVVSTGEIDTVDEDLNNVTDATDIERNILSTLEEQEAKDLSDYDWGYTYPRVLSKPDSFKAGQQFVEAVVNNLCKRGLSPGQAWAYYGVEIRDNSRNQWSKRCGYSDHSAVSEAVRKAKQKLPSNY